MSNSFVTPWNVDCQAPLSMEFFRQEYWSRLLFPSPRVLLIPGIKPMSPALAGGFSTAQPPGMWYYFTVEKRLAELGGRWAVVWGQLSGFCKFSPPDRRGPGTITLRFPWGGGCGLALRSSGLLASELLPPAPKGPLHPCSHAWPWSSVSGT